MKNKKELKKKINELIGMGKNIYPRVKYNILIPGIEGEDAAIEFFGPKRYENKLNEILRPIAVDILVDAGYFISVSAFVDRNSTKT